MLGDAGILAPDKLATFQFWSVPAGTGQPAGEWVKIALPLSHDMQLSTSARLMALLTMTLADTTVPTVGAKFTYRHWRPATAIREAETDGNPLTQPNPSWTPRAGSTGGTPEYPSGHSSYSGAAAAVLAGFFCADTIRFVHTTDHTDPGQGWTCFGSDDLGPDHQTEWVDTWTPNGTETILQEDAGFPVAPGSLVLLQIHYNLLDTDGRGGETDKSGVRLRLADGTAATKPLATLVVQAPIELPCATDESGPLCDRAAAVADVAKRFGAEVAETEGQLLQQCSNGNPFPATPKPATTRYRSP